MKLADIDRIIDWVVRRGLDGATRESDLLPAFCERCNAAGLPITRALALIDTLHPIHEGTVFRWRSDAVEENPATQYGPSNEGAAAETWRRSPFYHLLQTGGEELRRRIGFGETADFPIFHEMQEAGHTDYIVFVHRFATEATIGEMDCFYSRLVDAPSRRLRRYRHTSPAAAGAGARPRHQERCARAHRQHAGRGVSRPRRRPPRARRTYPTRRCRPHRGGAVVLRPAQLHDHHRQRPAGRDHPAAQRLRRSRRHLDPRGWRRRAEADRRRHAGPVPRRPMPPRRADGRSQPRRSCAPACAR